MMEMAMPQRKVSSARVHEWNASGDRQLAVRQRIVAVPHAITAYDAGSAGKTHPSLVAPVALLTLGDRLQMSAARLSDDVPGRPEPHTIEQPGDG
jgi:hypothetical protein